MARTAQDQAEDVAADAINILAASDGKAVKVEHASPEDDIDDNETERIAAGLLKDQGKSVRRWQNGLIVADSEEAIAEWAVQTPGSETAEAV